jgi:molecular chaperone DnaK
MMRLGSLRNLRRKQQSVVLQQKREIIVLLGPLIAGGIALVVFGTVGKYVVRALKRMENDGESIEGSLDVPEGVDAHTALATCFGVDIGSTFSRVSFFEEGTTKILESKEGMRATSTVVYKGDNDTVGHIASSKKWTNRAQVGYGYHIAVGLPDTEKIVSDILKSLSTSNHEHTNGEEVSASIGGENVSASALRTIFARDLYSTAMSKVLISGVPTVISTPNFFSATQKMSAVNSTRDGGFNCINVVPDAVGALLGAHHTGTVPTLDGKFVIVDVGGYITQISVVECDASEPNKPPIIIAEHTLFDVGGEFVSDALATHLATSFQKKSGIDISKDPLAKQRLYDAVEAAKIDLSKSLSTVISIPYITADASGPKHLDTTLSRATFESLLAPMVAKISTPLRDVLTTAGVAIPSRDLTGFLVVGGGARMPIVQRVAQESIGMAPIVPQEPEELTATGAAVFSKYCS